MKNKKIVLFAPGHIGDFIWFTSVISLIKAYDKDIRIILITYKFCANLIDSKFFNIDVILLNKNLFCNKNKFIRSIYKIIFIFNLFNRFKLFRFDIFFAFSTPPGFYLFLLKKMYKINRIIYGQNIIAGSTIEKKYLKYCFRVINFQNLKDMHIMLKFQLLVKDYFKTYNLSIPVLPKTKHLSDKISNSIGKSKTYKIAFCTRGSADWKFLDINFLKNLMQKINDLYDTTFFIVGTGKPEFDDTRKLKELLPDLDIRSMYNKTTLLELIEFMRNIDVLISIDTGVVHIASALNIPVISLCGPTFPILSAPVSHKGVVLYSKVSCSPCDNKINSKDFVCNDMKCLKSITAEMVFEEVKKILK